MQFKKTLLATTLAVSVVCSGGLRAHSDAALVAAHNIKNNAQREQMNQAATKRVGKFAQSLQKTMQGALAKGGFPNGIAVCKEEAPAIAASLSTDGWQIGRTSLKIRNSSNVPDNWEQKVLESFEAQKQQGAAVTSLMYSEIVDLDGQKTFRFMKAIPTKEMCLACHGSNLDSKVAETLRREYPHDKATGLSTSDIRGAFSVIKRL